MNVTIILPHWAVIIIMIIWCINQIIQIVTNKSLQRWLYQIKLFIFYHNDEELYKQKIAANKAKQALCRERYRTSGKYHATSLANLLNKNKKK